MLSITEHAQYEASLSSMRCTLLQGAKGKRAATAAVSLDPDILKQCEDSSANYQEDNSEDRVQKEIEVTSVLIQRFAEHNDTWDRLQASQPHPVRSSVSTASLCRTPTVFSLTLPYRRPLMSAPLICHARTYCSRLCGVKSSNGLVVFYWTFFTSLLHHRRFMQEALSTVDVLAAFGAFTETTVGNTCRPLILPAIFQGGASAVLELKGLWNPCAVPLEASGCIVPNDLSLGSRYMFLSQCTCSLGSFDDASCI